MPLYPPAPQPVFDAWGTHDCRVDWVDSATVKLTRQGGQYLMINGVRCVIPEAGITGAIVPTTGAYFIYATRTGNAVTGLAAATGSYAMDSFGMPCVNGNAEQTMVGLAYSVGGMVNHGHVCSYWNRKPRVNTGSVSAVQSTSTTLVQFGGNVRWCHYAGETYEAFCSGTAWGLGVDALLVYTQLVHNNSPIGVPSCVCPRFNGWYCPIAQKFIGQAANNIANQVLIGGWINTNGGGAYKGQWTANIGVRWMG